ncbi:MAG TPA: TonB C-terminal domain-containing protein [Verrucomicrobiae bacterium]|nr:TonB C-terminal domain-containing protein [Verrucomicrobiae bacterium]
MISFTFHAALVVVLVYLAARSGMLGDQIKKITISMVKEHKPPDKPKPPPPHIEPPKAPPKIVTAPKIAVAKAPPPTAAPVVAPPAQVLPSFDFGGGKAVATSSDPIELYRGALQYAFQSKWIRPDNLDDDKYVDEIRVSVSKDGQISNPQWEKSSGNTVWDDSVRKAIEAVSSMDRPPPTNFPSSVVIRFDVTEESESILQ